MVVNRHTYTEQTLQGQFTKKSVIFCTSHSHTTILPRSRVATVPLKILLTPPSLYSFTAQSKLLEYLAAALDSLWICIRHLILSPGAATMVVKIPENPPANTCWVILQAWWWWWEVGKVTFYTMTLQRLM